MKQLFTVVIETEVIVLAESADKARRIAQDAMRVDIDASTFDYVAVPMNGVPGGWDSSCLPYGSADKSLGDLIDDGAAPTYTKTLEALKTAAARHGWNTDRAPARDPKE